MKALNEEDFVKILKKFADNADDVLSQRDQIVCCINDEEYSLRLFHGEDGVLFCEESKPLPGIMKARTWIEKRLANLDGLARRILDIIPDDQLFIPVPSSFESLAVRDGDVHDIEQTTEALFDRLRRGADWSTQVYYLLSEAGEGKTCIMYRLARVVAEQYLAHQEHFLFLPIGLDGRPFLRFDEVVIGVLAQKYRFRRFYFEAIMELAKWGFLVLGLDGFEEMTVEGQENKVISSLGNLLQQHDSSGAIVISARKAFYEYALKAQGPLMDSIREFQIDFYAFRLKPWGEQQLRRLMEKVGIPELDAQHLYNQLADRLGSDHPILTRPVLARRMVAMTYQAITDEGNAFEDLLQTFSTDKDPQKVMQNFVELLLKREASEKWIRYSGSESSVYQQLLTAQEHAEMLGEVVEEMWLSSMEYIQKDVLQSVVELYCENKAKNPSDTHECREKILHHAMLVQSGNGYFFCHDAFRQYFLGYQLAYCLREGRRQIGDILSQNAMLDGVVDTASFLLAAAHVDFGAIKAVLDHFRQGYIRTTTVNQNVASLLSGLWKRLHPQGVQFDNLYFAASSTKDVPFRNAKFVNCVFENLFVPPNATFENVTLENCSLTALTIQDRQKIALSFDETSRPAKLIVTWPDSEDTEEIFSPQEILARLWECGCCALRPVDTSPQQAKAKSPDERYFRAFERLLRVFQRMTGVSGAILKMRFGSQWSEWERDYLPRFIDEKLIQLAPWHGSGQDDRYLLSISARLYEFARKNCNNDFAQFCKLMRDS